MTVRRLAVDEDLSAYIRNAWFVDWDVPDGFERPQSVLAPPAVNISVQPAEDAVSGMQTEVDHRTLEGRSWVRGILFRSAGFGAIVGPHLHQWVDRREPLDGLFGPVNGLREDLREADDDHTLKALQAWLRPFVVDPDPKRRQLAQDVVDHIRDHPDVRTVAVLVARTGLKERSLQRLLKAWVGLGPKHIIRRYRLHEAAHRLTKEPEHDLATLAFDLGYSDQAHFSRDFARVVGCSPGRYGESVNDDRSRETGDSDGSERTRDPNTGSPAQ